VHVQFTITDEGKTKGIAVLEATNDEFGRSAAESVSHWLYAPNVVDGVAVEAPGIHTIIRFVLSD
jgi:TonB family protein